MRRWLFWIVAALSMKAGLWAAQAEERPLLQLDAGGHMAKIEKIAFTPDGKQLVSASDDKVIRVWDVATGKTLRTIRGEIAPGDTGKVFAIALSPDGKWLAAGGFLGTGETQDAIRLYDFASGELKVLLKGHDDVVHVLAFSPDGRRLISGSSDKTAILWDMSPVTAPGAAAKAAPAILHPLHRLKAHTAHVNAAGFTADGARAVTGADDNDLRLWRVADGKEIAALKGHANRVRSLAVTRDGTIASGDDSGEIRLWNGRTGAFLRTLARQGRAATSLSFSPDGKTLLSGTGTTGAGGNECHAWDVATSRERVTYREHGNIVIATAISADGRWAATGGGNNHEIHIWDLKTGKRRAGPDGASLTLGGTGKPIWAAGFSADSKAIGWGNTWTGLAALGTNPLEFALALPFGSEGLGTPQPLGETAAKGFRRVVAEQDGWSLSHRKGGAYGLDAILDIKQAGRVAASVERSTTDGNRHISYSFTPDGQTIISGGSWGVITAYDRAGKKLGDFVGHEGDVWAVALSPDGKYLVSGSDDQTVRLWDIKTRALLATLFRGSDGEWVIWTPEGFFAGSEKGAERVGWHINQGPDKEARYVTGAQLRKVFFRPDLVAEKIKGDPNGKVSDAAAKINIKELLRRSIAPIIEILSPSSEIKSDDATVQIRIKVTDQGGGIGRIYFRLNGQERAGGLSAALLDAKGEQNAVFDLAEPANVIEALAETRDGAVTSLPAKISAAVDERALKGAPNLFVLAIGVNAYHDVSKKLTYAVSDAGALSEVFQEAGATFYRKPPEAIILKDDEATSERIEKAFAALAAKMKAIDVFVLFLAGHGKTVDANYYFLPAAIGNFAPGTIVKQGIGPEQWRRWFALIPAVKSLWVLDTCESGSAAAMFRGAGEFESAWQRMKDATGRTIVAASGAQELASEGYRGFGLLTYAAIESLIEGDAANKGEIDLLSMMRHVDQRVPVLSRELKACQPKLRAASDYCQRPVVDYGGRNYPLLPAFPKARQWLERQPEPGVLAAIPGKPTHFLLAEAEIYRSRSRGAESEIVARLPRGRTVAVIEVSGGIAYVARDGKALGYVDETKLAPLD
jgi:WD40 repeat protein